MRYSLFIILLFISCKLTAQDRFIFSPISSTNGLSDNRVRAMSQLPDGRMAFVTEGMVDIYDGASFRYMHTKGQKAYSLKKYSQLHRVYIDNENHLWIKNRYKLMLFDIRTEKAITNIDSVFLRQGINEKIADVFVDSELNFWYLTEADNLFYRDNKTKTPCLLLNHVSEKNGISNPLLDIVTHNNLTFLFYQSGEMVCYQTDTRKELYRETPSFFKGKGISRAMAVPYKKFIYEEISEKNKGLLLRFNVANKKWELVLETNYSLNTLTVDAKGNCWVSTMSGLWMISENLQEKLLIPELEFPDGHSCEAELSTQFNDPRGGLWVGSVNRGVFYYHPDRFKFRNFGRKAFNLSKSDKLAVLSFTETSNTILTGTQYGVYSYSPHTGDLKKYNQLPGNIFCNMLLTDSKQRIWACTHNNGLFCLTNNKARHFDVPSCCFYLYELGNENFVLCTSEGIGLFIPKNGNYKKANIPAGRKLDNNYQLVKYKPDTLLGYCDEGLFFYNYKTNKITYPENPNNRLLQYSNRHYHCLYTDSRGVIWIGTTDGLCIFNPGNNTSKTFSTDDGIASNSIRSITEDNFGRIWVATSNGISRIEVVGDPNEYRFTISNFNHYDGVIENEFSPRAVFKTTDGRILWGGLDGFNETELTPNDTTKQQTALPLFTKLTLSGSDVILGTAYDGNVILKQSICYTNEIHLKYFQNFIGVEFSALNYINPIQTRYRYKLEGIDNTWHETKTPDGIGRINYTNLSPGKYRLIVYASNSPRQWGNRYAELTLVIYPPFWKTAWAYAFYIFIFMGGLYLAFSFYLRKGKQKIQKQQKEELDQLKFAFFTNISHELRTPLTLILTPLSSILEKTDDVQLKKKLSGIYRNANDLLKLVNQLLDFRKLEMKGEKLQLSWCNLDEFFKSISYSFNELASNKKIDFVYVCNTPELFAYIDRDKLLKILNNLLSNAFKFTPDGGKIMLLLEKSDTSSFFKIQVTDTGCGIPEVDLSQIFERFYQIKRRNEQNTGSGIGLHLVKEYVELHNGTVEVKSIVNKGSAFTVILPTDLKPDNKFNNNSQEPEQEKHLTILVVEDNPEFSQFIYDELSDKYQVIVAHNGKEGLDTVRQKHPDLVITDVMMPEMSGTELCRTLKNDIQISHIPVILLTAKASDQAQIEGFEAGADAYITKPFNMNILQLRISNLIEQQEQRRDAFKNTITINPATFTTTSVDEELIKKVLQHIEKNIDNSLYSVEQLSKDMFMDRSGLYRKLSAITGQTPVEFIRSVRMKRAAQLLQEGLSVNETSDRVGFATTSYFIKCFQEEFGIKPSLYKTERRL